MCLFKLIHTNHDDTINVIFFLIFFTYIYESKNKKNICIYHCQVSIQQANNFASVISINSVVTSFSSIQAK